MDKHNFVREGVSRLPPGFRFQPTDEELVFQYLKCKMFSLPLPASIIPELHFSKFDPWDLPGDPEEERYFFTKKEAKYRSGKRANRATSSGYWKATGSDKHISPPPRQNLGMAMKGLRKTLVFHRGKSPNGRRTDWFMHEYSLILNFNNSMHHDQGCNGMSGMEDWVICCVFLKERMEKEDDDVNMLEYGDNFGFASNSGTMNVDEFDNRIDNRNDFGNYTTMSASCYSSSSSSSNSITAVSSNDQSEYEEETNSSPKFL